MNKEEIINNLKLRKKELEKRHKQCLTDLHTDDADKVNTAVVKGQLDLVNELIIQYT